MRRNARTFIKVMLAGPGVALSSAGVDVTGGDAAGPRGASAPRGPAYPAAG